MKAPILFSVKDGRICSPQISLLVIFVLGCLKLWRSAYFRKI